jgi:hypothetical protein
MDSKNKYLCYRRDSFFVFFFLTWRGVSLCIPDWTRTCDLPPCLAFYDLNPAHALPLSYIYQPQFFSFWYLLKLFIQSFSITVKSVRLPEWNLFSIRGPYNRLKNLVAVVGLGFCYCSDCYFSSME